MMTMLTIRKDNGVDSDNNDENDDDNDDDSDDAKNDVTVVIMTTTTHQEVSWSLFCRGLRALRAKYQRYASGCTP